MKMLPSPIEIFPLIGRDRHSDCPKIGQLQRSRWCSSDWLSFSVFNFLTRGVCLSDFFIIYFLTLFYYYSIQFVVVILEDVPPVEFMYLVFTRMPGESYRRRLRSLLLYLCYVFRALINSLVCWFVLVTKCQEISYQQSNVFSSEQDDLIQYNTTLLYWSVKGNSVVVQSR